MGRQYRMYKKIRNHVNNNSRGWYWHACGRPSFELNIIVYVLSLYVWNTCRYEELLRGSAVHWRRGWRCVPLQRGWSRTPTRRNRKLTVRYRSAIFECRSIFETVIDRAPTFSSEFVCCSLTSRATLLTRLFVVLCSSNAVERWATRTGSRAGGRATKLILTS